jgi:hypothetical protein
MVLYQIVPYFYIKRLTYSLLIFEFCHYRYFYYVFNRLINFYPKGSFFALLECYTSASCPSVIMIPAAI